MPEHPIVPNADVHDFLRKFLREQPLYAARTFTYEHVPEVQRHDFFPASMMFPCAACRCETSWTRLLGKLGQNEVPFRLIDDDHFYLTFVCAHCRKSFASFWVSARVGAAKTCTVRKFGQSPAWSIAVSDAVARALPADALTFYRKAVICSSQNFGLGAAAYFRRVVEETVGDLLDLIEQAAKLDPTNVDENALRAVTEARRSHQASDKLKLVAPQLPGHLRSGGSNPLSHLYDAYSEGVHVLSDDEALDTALRMRTVIDFVLPALTDQLANARAYQAQLAKAPRKRAAEAPSPAPRDDPAEGEPPVT
jgi:hypothetical protein